jgi:hypothetical protein
MTIAKQRVRDIRSMRTPLFLHLTSNTNDAPNGGRAIDFTIRWRFCEL